MRKAPAAPEKQGLLASVDIQIAVDSMHVEADESKVAAPEATPAVKSHEAPATVPAHGGADQQVVLFPMAVEKTGEAPATDHTSRPLALSPATTGMHTLALPLLAPLTPIIFKGRQV